MRSSSILAVAVLVLAACGDEDSPPPDAVFRFDSGGAHHIQGFGAWRLEATRVGRVETVHVVRDEEKVYPPSDLSPEDAKALWDLVESARLGERVVEDRPGVPDEVQLTFALEVEGKPPVEVVIWRNDLDPGDALAPILDFLRTFIEDVHGVKPVF